MSLKKNKKQNKIEIYRMCITFCILLHVLLRLAYKKIFFTTILLKIKYFTASYANILPWAYFFILLKKKLIIIQPILYDMSYYNRKNWITVHRFNNSYSKKKNSAYLHYRLETFTRINYIYFLVLPKLITAWTLQLISINITSLKPKWKKNVLF